MWIFHCRTRAFQNIEGHHRPVIASSFLAAQRELVPLRSPFFPRTLQWILPRKFSFFLFSFFSFIRRKRRNIIKKEIWKEKGSPGIHQHKQKVRWNYLASWGLVRYRNKPDKSLHQLRTAMHHYPKNRERAIGLSPIFSFRRNLPPALSCSPKQLDS